MKAALGLCLQPFFLDLFLYKAQLTSSGNASQSCQYMNSLYVQVDFSNISLKGFYYRKNKKVFAPDSLQNTGKL